MSIKDYQPTPAQVEGIKIAEAERKAIIERLKEKWKLESAKKAELKNRKKK